MFSAKVPRRSVEYDTFAVLFFIFSLHILAV